MTGMISEIFVDERVREETLTRRILERRGDIGYRLVTDAEMRAMMRGMRLSTGKRKLYITRLDGGFVKPCPATSSPYLCCRYTVINQAVQCPMDCSYCILQDYLDTPVVTVYANVEEMFSEIDSLTQRQPDRFFRFGTGELTDSLALDELTGLSCDLADQFAVRKNALLELKTKTVVVDRLLACRPDRVVVSWSLNPASVVGSEELGAAPVEARLAAARRCMDEGFLLGFHFDPILSIDGFDAAYRNLVDDIYRHVDGERIAWVSLGSLRFPPSLKSTIRDRFPGTKIIHKEMVRGLDGKMRYPRPLRVRLFKKVYGWLKDHQPDLFVYLCMEPPWVWDAVTGEAPEDNAELDYRFASSLHERYPELGMTMPCIESYRENSGAGGLSDEGSG